ncbi:TPA: hypothetical protein ACH3X2_011037 [Trebouxia sp. C0005]|nr:MAG: hypothetical protein FRX49_02113 [Trebouxia sp. A1-2]
MHRRKQGHKDGIKQLPEAHPATTFALLSVRLTERAQGANFLTWFAATTASNHEPQLLWRKAEQFFMKEMGCMGPLIKVSGDLKPAGSYLILAPRVSLLPDMLQAAKEFMTACASFKSLHVQLQLGRSAVVDQIGVQLVAPSPFFNAQWEQHRYGSECVQLFAALAPKHATVHALISRADFSAEATKLPLQYGSDLEQVLAQVHSGPNADSKSPLEQCTAGCTMKVPADGMVFMMLLTVPAGDKILYNLVT